MKVKIFHESGDLVLGCEELEKSINEFIKDKKIIEIKYDTRGGTTVFITYE